MAKDSGYGTWAVTFRDSKGRETTIPLTDTRADVEGQATFFGPSYGKVVKVERAK